MEASLQKVIFIIDDDEATLFIIEDTLKKTLFNISIHSFSSVERALGNLTLKPDIIILDHYLNYTNGIDSIPVILEFIPEVSIAIISSQTDAKLISKAYLTGVSEYFMKDENLFDNIKSFVNSEINLTTENVSFWENVVNSWKTSAKQELTKVVVIDDDHTQSFSLKYTLETNPLIEVDTFLSIKDFISNCQYTPHIIFLDYQLGTLVLGKSDITIIKQLHPTAKLVCLTRNKNIDVVFSLKHSGIDAYVYKNNESLKALPKFISV